VNFEKSAREGRGKVDTCLLRRLNGSKYLHEAGFFRASDVVGGCKCDRNSKAFARILQLSVETQRRNGMEFHFGH